MIAIFYDMAHIVGAGSGIAAAYCASKFAVRGLTQAAGMPSLGVLRVHGIDEGFLKLRNSANTGLL